MIVNEQFTRFAEDNPQVADALQNALPVELIEPADVSNAVVWLCTDEARYITGTTLPVDAGICNKL
jgi:NAD(P)-dependent dehydrogenase (short-subunit alcohol dehydrogenase family)